MTDIYVDGDACPVREEVYRVADRLGLRVFVVANGSSAYAVPGRIAERFATEGWQVRTVDGRDDDQLEKALSDRGIGAPNAVVATVLDLEVAA